MKKFISIFFSVCLSFVLTFKVQALEPYLIETSAMDFGDLIYIPGGCTMAYDTKLITNNTSSNICQSPEGQLGKYRIYANPNKTVQVKLVSHNDSGNGIIYVPDGELVSDAETVRILADTTTTIDSGTSGIIDIQLGGRLQINAPLSSSTLFKENFDIEFNEL